MGAGMKKTAVILGIFAMCGVQPAVAEITGLVGGGYGALRSGGSVYGGQGSLLVPLGDSGLNLQTDGTYQRAAVGGATVDDAGASANFFFRGDAASLGGAALGVTVRYDNLRAKIAGPASIIGDGDLTSYGAFAEFYLSPTFTLAAKVGGLSGLVEGGYAGGSARWYLSRNFALHGEYQYAKSGRIDMNGFGGGIGIYGLFGSPITTDLSYAHSEVGAGSSSDSIIASLIFHFGSNHPDIASWDRKGPTIWNGGFN